MEKKKQKKEKAPSPGGNPFDNTDTQHATIGCGLYQEKLPVAGKTIGEIRAEFSDRLEIADNAVATVAGVEQGNDYRVGANELVLFIQQAGEKGTAKKYETYAELAAAFKSGELDKSKYFLMLDKGGTSNSLAHVYDESMSDGQNDDESDKAHRMFGHMEDEGGVEGMLDALGIPWKWS